MYSLEERLKAVNLYIESDRNENYVMKALGYPSPNTLRNWDAEHMASGTLHRKSAPKPRFTQQQIEAAVCYYDQHEASLTQTCCVMGYPTRSVLREWIKKLRPDALKRCKKACKISSTRVKLTQEQKQAAVERFVVDRVPIYKVAAEYGVSKASLSKWKCQLLGKDSFISMKKEHLKVNTDICSSKTGLEAEIQTLQSQIHMLRMERDALEKAAELLKKGGGINLTQIKNAEKAELIDALRPRYQLKELLLLFGISKSSYCYQKHTITLPDKYAELRTEVKTIFLENYCAYGYRRIHTEIKKSNKVISEKVIRKIMREENLVAFIVKKRKYNSYQGEITAAVENIVDRNFHSDIPNTKWLTDITEFHIPAGKIYLSPIIDCFDGMAVSWSISTSPDAELVNSMLDNAISMLKESEHPIIHSDRGCHYRWPGWIDRMTKVSLTRSMSKKGCSPDNSACEGFFGRLKNEMFYGRSWIGVTIEQFIETLNSYIKWYNEKRIKISLGAMSPIEYRRSLGLIA